MAKFNHTAHRELWDWKAKNPDKDDRLHWPGWDYNGGKYKEGAGGCFACEYVSFLDIEIDICDGCDSCPLVWPNDLKCGDDFCEEIKRYPLFREWDHESNLQKRSELAAQIRDLPVRKGVEYI